MRSLFRLVICMSISCLIAGCNLSDSSYFREGIGTDIYSSELPNATALNDAYVALICRQAGLANEGETCDSPALGRYWATFVQAGMNDIDRRCDAYLAWLDDRKRSQTPVLNKLHALSAATIGVLNATGVGVNPITIVGLAFGLASDTFTNIQSRLVLEADHATVQAVVLDNQSKYRQEVIDKAVDNKPAAIYLLRGYLRICMPFSIETSMNNTLMVYHRSGAAALQPAGIFQRPALGAPVHRLEAFGVRPNPSQHPIGFAVDWAQHSRNVVDPDVGRWIGGNRDVLKKLELRWGVSGGENWYNPDTGHFSIERIFGDQHLSASNEASARINHPDL